MSGAVAFRKPFPAPARTHATAWSGGLLDGECRTAPRQPPDIPTERPLFSGKMLVEKSLCPPVVHRNLKFPQRELLTSQPFGNSADNMKKNRPFKIGEYRGNTLFAREEKRFGKCRELRGRLLELLKIQKQRKE